MSRKKFIAVILSVIFALVFCAFPVLAVQKEASPDAAADSSAVQPADFTSWEELTAAYPSFEIHEVKLPDGTAGRAAWSDFQKLVTAQENARVLAFTAGGSRIPEDTYSTALMEKDQTFALVSEDGALLELCIIADTGEPAASPTPAPVHIPTWSDICAENPDLKIETVHLASYLEGVPWLAFLMAARYVPELQENLAEGNVIIPFTPAGDALLTNAQMLAAPIRTGAHYLVMNRAEEVLALYEVGTFLPDEAGAALEENYPSWTEYCAQHRRIKVKETSVPDDLLQEPWIILNVIVQMSGYYLVIPFDTQGSPISPEAQRTVLVENGQHFALLQRDTGQVMALLDIVAHPASEPSSSAQPTLPPVIITPAPSPSPSAEPSLPPEDQPAPSLLPSSPLRVEESEEGMLLTGLTAGSEPVNVQELIGNFEIPAAYTWEVCSADGEPRTPEETVGTGCRLAFIKDGRLQEEYIIVMKGDVLGTGVISIAQLVRLAKALTGVNPLAGPWLLAADLNGSGVPDIADLTIEASLLNGKS